MIDTASLTTILDSTENPPKEDRAESIQLSRPISGNAAAAAATPTAAAASAAAANLHIPWERRHSKLPACGGRCDVRGRVTGNGCDVTAIISHWFLFSAGGNDGRRGASREDKEKNGRL